MKQASLILGICLLALDAQAGGILNVPPEQASQTDLCA